MKEDDINTLADVREGGQCVIVKVNGHGGFRHRVMEMGFVKGERVTVLKNAPLQDPIEYKIMQSHVSLRRSEANHIEVVAMDDVTEDIVPDSNGTFSESVQRRITEKTKTITVALVGTLTAERPPSSTMRRDCVNTWATTAA